MLTRSSTLKTLTHSEGEMVISVIIVNYNGMHLTKACVDSLKKQTHRDFEIIVVDNNSSKDNLEEFENKYTDVRLIRNKKNEGFGAGVNLGAKYARGEYIFFLNNDIEVKKDCLEVFAKEKKPVMVPKILFHQKKSHVNSFGIIVNYLGLNLPRHINRKNENFKEKETAAAGIMCLKKSTFKEVGGFDKDFFLYHEDSDISWRLRMMGYKLHLINDAVIYHKYHFSISTDKLYNSEINRLRLLLKNYRIKTLVLLSPMLLLLEVSQWFYALMHGWLGKKLGMYFNIDYKKLFKKRKILQNKRKITDRELTSLFVPGIKFELVKSPAIKYFLSPVSVFYWNIIRWLI